MTIHHLIIFRTVCEEMGFTKAANKLYMTQPAVSHVIADLEKEAGTPLFERKGGRIALNGQGELLLQKAVRLLELYEDMEEGLKDLESSAVLRVGSSITIANFWLPSIVKVFQIECKETPLEIEVDSAVNTAARLFRGELDLAFIEGASYINGFENIPFSSYEVIPLCSPDYLKDIGKKQEDFINIEEFASMKLLLREKGSAIRDVLEGAFLHRELALIPYWTSVNSQALVRAAESGLGIAVLPDILVEQEIKEGTLVKVSVKDLYLKNVNHIIYHKSKYMTSSMKAMIEIVKSNGTMEPDRV